MQNLLVSAEAEHQRLTERHKGHQAESVNVILLLDRFVQDRGRSSIMPVRNAREIFEVHMPRRFGDASNLSERVNGTYKFVLSGADGGTWFVDLTQSPGAVREEDVDAQCTLTAASTDFLAIVNGKLDGKVAFLTGKLKVAGDVGLAMKLPALLRR